MKLSEWLKREDITRLDFAGRIDVSPATVTALCNGPAPWMSRTTALAIHRETGGEVGPNDFLDPPASAATEAGAKQEERA